MSLTINHNLMASNTARNLAAHYGSLGSSTRRLSSGLRVNQAADDAAGLAAREMMRADVRTLGQGTRNANDAISMIQVADGALQVIDEKLIRMKELATQAATGTYTSDQRAIIDDEFQAMKAEIDRIAESTEFNNIHPLMTSLNIVNKPMDIDLWSPFATDGINNSRNIVFNTLNVYQGNIYAASTNNFVINGGTRVFRYEGNTWQQVNLNGFGTQNNDASLSSSEYQNKLVYGTRNLSSGCQVHAFDGLSWTMLSSDGFGDSNNRDAGAMVEYNGRLYTGTFNSVTGAV